MEYKFRAKRRDTGEWVYGSLIDKDYILQYIDQAESWTPLTDDHKVTCRATWIFSETVGQYTGLRDKIGIDIYEGDELRLVEQRTYLFGEVGKVVFESDYGGFIVEGKWSKNQHHELLTCDVAIDCEVNPPADSPALNNMNNFDPGTKQEEVKDDAAIAPASEQATQESAEEGNTEG